MIIRLRIGWPIELYTDFFLDDSVKITPDMMINMLSHIEPLLPHMNEYYLEHDPVEGTKKICDEVRECVLEEMEGKDESEFTNREIVEMVNEHVSDFAMAWTNFLLLDKDNKDYSPDEIKLCELKFESADTVDYAITGTHIFDAREVSAADAFFDAVKRYFCEDVHLNEEYVKNWIENRLKPCFIECDGWHRSIIEFVDLWNDDWKDIENALVDLYPGLNFEVTNIDVINEK